MKQDIKTEVHRNLRYARNGGAITRQQYRSLKNERDVYAVDRFLSRIGISVSTTRHELSSVTIVRHWDEVIAMETVWAPRKPHPSDKGYKHA